MSRCSLLRHGVWTGGLFGVLAGVADALTTAHPFLGRDFLAMSVMAWCLVAIPAGFLAGAGAALLVRPEAPAGWRAPARLAALLSAGGALGAAGFLVLVHVNVVYLGSDTGKQALLADGAIALAALVAALVLMRFLERAFRGPGRHGARLLLGTPAGRLALAGVVLGLSAVFWRGGVGAVGAPSRLAGTEAPNVVLILVDTLRRDHLSGEGYERLTSPAFDELARRGAHFSHFTSQSCYTKPSVASLITSQYPSEHGVGHLRTVLGAERTTLAEIFHRAGWHTAQFVSNTIVGAEFGFAQGTEVFRTLPTQLVPKTKLGYALLRITERGRRVPLVPSLVRLLERLERRLAQRRGAETLSLKAREIVEAFRSWRRSLGGEPYFAYLHFMEPHAPYRPPRETAARFAAPGEPLREEHPPMVGLFLPFSRAESLSASERRGLVRAYDAEIAALDATLGDLIRELLAPGPGRATIVAVTADHGEEFYEHGGWGHGQSLHEELLEVPFLLAGPGVPPGVEIAAPALLVDVAPTLLELAGVAVPPQMRGVSLVPWMQAAASGRAAPVDPNREILAEIVYGEAYWARSLRRGRWKLIVSRLGERESVQLFDLAADPREEEDLSARHPELREALRARLEDIVSAATRGAAPVEKARLDPVTLERLKALGYVE